MARYSTNSIKYDAMPQISIADLKKRNCLKQGVKRTIIIRWEKYEKDLCSVSIIIDMKSEYPNIAFNYNFGGENRDYSVYLTRTLSNLGKGIIFYFICPDTGKRCRKLYLINGHFTHRTTFKGLYSCQSQSKYYRNLDKLFSHHSHKRRLKDQLAEKYFKKSYSGKPTKKYIKILQELNRQYKIK